MHTLAELPLKNKKVLVRVDFNVPLTEEGKVLDNTRIKAALPTIQYLLSQGCSIILMSHLGRPKNAESKLSLKPVANELERLLERLVQMAPDCVGEATQEMAKKLQNGQILLLENLRFHPEEENPDKNPQFAKELSRLADFYVDDAFGAAHRAHASIVEVPKLMAGCRTAPGFLMEKELKFLSKVFENPEHPFLVLIGGAKISSKIGVLHALLDHVDQLAVGGGMAFTFLKAEGIEVGKSVVELDFIEEAKRIIGKCREKQIKLLLPVDCVVAKSIEDTQTAIKTIQEGISSDYQGFDIGPETIKIFSKAIGEAKTILWNGPMGVFEKTVFASGTKEVANAFIHCNAVTIAGGGETVAALQSIPGSEHVSHISTGGGATLEFLEQGTLPGVEVLKQ